MANLVLKISTLLSASPLDEHAVFKFKKEDPNWTFMSYASSTFIFQGKNDNGVLIMQLPPETLLLATKEALAQQFIARYKTKMKNINVLKEGEQTIGNMEGYQVLLQLESNEDSHLGLIYLFIVQSSKAPMVVQGMGKENTPETIVVFDDFLNNLELKND